MPHNYLITNFYILQTSVNSLNVTSCKLVEAGDRFAIFIKHGQVPSSSVFSYSFDNPMTLSYTFPDTTQSPSIGDTVTFDRLPLPLSFSDQIIQYIGKSICIVVYSLSGKRLFANYRFSLKSPVYNRALNISNITYRNVGENKEYLIYRYILDV